MLLAVKPHAECGAYSITGNPLVDIIAYTLIGLVLLAILGTVIAFIVGAWSAGRGN